MWNTRTNRFAWKYYLRDLDGVTPPSYAAPARETNYAGLPPAYTYVGTEEPFYCETLEYVANLKRAGVEASVDVHPHWFHAYDMLFPFAKKPREAVHASKSITSMPLSTISPHKRSDFLASHQR